MSKKKLNKTETLNAIIEHCKASVFISIDVEGFKKIVKTEKDILEACEFCRIEPIYN